MDLCKDELSLELGLIIPNTFQIDKYKTGPNQKIVRKSQITIGKKF